MLSTLLLTLVVSANAQRVEAQLTEATEQLRAFRETKALETLKRARAEAADSPELLARIYLLTGLAHGQLAHEREAVDAFVAALRLEPNITPPEKDTSPKVLEWFNRARTRQGMKPLGAKADAPPPAPVETKVVYVPAPVEPKPEPSRAPLYLGVGIAAAGVAAAATGLVFGLRARDAEAQSRREPVITPSAAAHADAQQNAGTANALFIAAGVLGVGGAVVIGVSF